MKNRATERSNYWFDPTANQASAQVDRNNRPKIPLNHIVERASKAETLKYQGKIFEPGNPILDITNSRQLLKSIESRRLQLIKQYGRDPVRDIPEFRELTVELFKVRDIYQKALASKNR